MAKPKKKYSYLTIVEKTFNKEKIRPIKSTRYQYSNFKTIKRETKDYKEHKI